MKQHALGTLPREAKGRMTPAPKLSGIMKAVADQITSWPHVEATGHWDLAGVQIDGIDFYVNAEELGHIHLDGSIHLATNASIGNDLLKAGIATPFRWQPGWVASNVHDAGVEASVGLFRRNYESLMEEE